MSIEYRFQKFAGLLPHLVSAPVAHCLPAVQVATPFAVTFDHLSCAATLKQQFRDTLQVGA